MLLKEVKEQLQEDLIAYLDEIVPAYVMDAVCEIVLKNFRGIDEN